MENFGNANKRSANRRSFLRAGVLGVGAVGTALLPERMAAFEQDDRQLNRGDIDILAFLNALEQVEADLWIQYAELGGATTQGPSCSPIDLPFTTGLAPNYVNALQVLDGDTPQYIADNTGDEISHHDFSTIISRRRAHSPLT